MAWMFVHLISILGMRNKVAVLVSWIWAYFAYPTSLRLLIHPERYPLRRRWGESEPPSPYISVNQLEGRVFSTDKGNPLFITTAAISNVATPASA